jgi:hypothetical protein
MDAKEVLSQSGIGVSLSAQFVEIYDEQVRYRDACMNPCLHDASSIFMIFSCRS